VPNVPRGWIGRRLLAISTSTSNSVAPIAWLSPAPDAKPGDLALSLLGTAAISMWSQSRFVPRKERSVDELIKELKDRAELSDEQAKAAAEVVAEWMKDEDKRKKVIAAALASTIAAAVVTVPI
jgi:hypothetical protein